MADQMPVVRRFQHIMPLMVQRYERYLPTAFDESLTMLEKMNKIIEHLNQIGELTNEVVDKWNEVMEWLLNNGLEEAVLFQLNKWLDDGTLADIINHTIFEELNNKIDANTTSIADLADLLDTTVADLQQQFDTIVADFTDTVNDMMADLQSIVDNITLSVDAFGAVGDGVTDDTAAIQAAIDRANQLGGQKVLFPSNTYRVDGFLTLYSNVKLVGEKGSVLDFTKRGVPSGGDRWRYFISAFGDYDTAVNLTNNANVNTSVVDLPTASFSEGDLIIIRSDRVRPDGTYGATAGEYAFVDEILTSGTMRLKSALHESYTVAENGRVHKVHPAENIVIDGLTFLGQGRLGNGDVDGDFGVGFTYCKDVRVENCKFIDIDEVQLEFRSCYNFRVNNCWFSHSKYFSPSGGVGTGKPSTHPIRGTVQYQIRVADCCQYGIIENCVGEGSRHMFNTGHSFRYMDGTTQQTTKLFGINRHITVENCHAKNTWHGGFATHNDVEYLTFVNCTAENSGYAGFNPRATMIKIIDCDVINAQRHTQISDYGNNIEVKGGQAINCDGVVSLLENNDRSHNHIVVRDMRAVNVNDGITLSVANYTGATQMRVTIRDNVIIQSSPNGNGSPIRLIGRWDATITGNHISVTDRGYQIRLENINRAVVMNNVCRDGERTFYADDVSNYVVFKDNVFINHQYDTIDNNATDPTNEGNVIF